MPFLSPDQRRALSAVGQALIPVPVQRWLQQRYVYNPTIQRLGLSVETPPLFDTVFFEVRTRCNGHCSFCAASVENDTRPDVSMTAETHEKVLREVAAQGFRGRVAYHNNSDPLIFRELPQFVAKAREILPASPVQILTNGRALTLDKITALLNAGIFELSVNHYGATTTGPVPKVLLDVADQLLPRFFAAEDLDIIGLGPERDRQSKQPKFRYLVERRLENDVLTSRAGTSPNKQTPSPAPRGFCYFPWTQLIVSADGRVPMCCCDLNIRRSVGNAIEQPVMDIWHGAPYRAIREALWRGDRQAIEETCRHCDFYGVKRLPDSVAARVVHLLTS